MDWTEQIFRYCERGQDAQFWAEPLNALSNVAFLFAGGLALRAYRRSGAAAGLRPQAPAGLILVDQAGVARPLAARGVGAGLAALSSVDAVPALISLIFIIGAGSFVFHTFATRWSALADVGPIGLFMLAYFVYSLRVLLGLPWAITGAALLAFVFAMAAAGSAQCAGPLPGLADPGTSLQSIAAFAPGPCLNGGLGYVPAGVALAVVAGALAVNGHPAWRTLALATAIFAASLILRTLDQPLCDVTLALGRPRGTHALWHVLNAVTLYLLLTAAIGHPGQRRSA